MSNGITTSFSSDRIVLVHGYDPRCAQYWDEGDAGHEQTDGGPVYLVVGRRAPTDKLVPLAQRFGFTVEELMAFRDAGLVPKAVNHD